jgi:hypothetical protein
MVRNVLSTFVGLLLTAALLWGECAPCQQLIPQKKASASCCDASGKCKTGSSQQTNRKLCKSPATAVQHVSGDSGLLAQLRSASFPMARIGTLFVRSLVLARPALASSPPDKSPPDLCRLYSVFLI